MHRLERAGLRSAISIIEGPVSTIALVSDLLFSTRIKGTADQLGIPVSVVRTAAALDDAVAAGVQVAIIDLNVEGVDPVEAIRRCKSGLSDAPGREAAGPPGPRPEPVVIAYGSHVDVQRQESARAAGADLVLARSQFTARLPELLSQYGRLQPRV
jgi:CheY-like chemotaxis protein